MRMERCKAGSKKNKSRRPITTESKHNNKHMEIFARKLKKYNENQFIKKNGLENRKIKNHPPS